MKKQIKEKLIIVADYLAVVLIKVVVITIAFFILFGILVCNEIKDAREFCDSADGEYHFRLLEYPNQHICNENPIFAYQKGWNWDISKQTISLDDISIN